MKQGIQTDFPNKELKEYGCYFFDILRWAELDGGLSFSEKDILALLSAAKKAGHVGGECFIQNAAGLYTLARGGGAAKKYNCVIKTSEKPKGGRYILCNKKPMYTHFTLWDGEGVWDSLAPKRPGVSAYKPDSYRVLHA